MEMSRLKVVLTIGVVLFYALEPATAGKGGNKGGPNNSDPMWTAGSVEFSDLPGDGLRSDGLGPYADGANETECIHDQPNAIVECYTGPNRSVYLSLGTCLSESCEDPFGGSAAGFVAGPSRFIADDFRNYEHGWPGVGETMISSENGGGLNVGFFVGTTRYWAHWIGPGGDITATGYDDDVDGVVDRVVMTAQPTSVMMLSKIVEKSGKGNKTYLGFENVGEFTNMPFTATFYVFDYQRPPTTNLPWVLAE